MNHFSEIMDTGTDHIGVNRKMGTGNYAFTYSISIRKLFYAEIIFHSTMGGMKIAV